MRISVPLLRNEVQLLGLFLGFAVGVPEIRDMDGERYSNSLVNVASLMFFSFRFYVFIGGSSSKALRTNGLDNKSLFYLRYKDTIFFTCRFFLLGVVQLGVWRFPAGMEGRFRHKKRRLVVSTGRKHHKPPH